jgi:hypothetical protein
MNAEKMFEELGYFDNEENVNGLQYVSFAGGDVRIEFYNNTRSYRVYVIDCLDGE